MPKSGSHLFAITSSASAWEMAINGVSQGAAGANYNSGGALVIGNGSAGQGINGDIAEIILYNRLLTAVEADQAGAYLTQKYGLVTSYGLPVISSLSPADNNTGITVDLNLVATFNEALVRGTGNTIKLQVSEAASTSTITYLKGLVSWLQPNLLYGTNGIAALTFADVPVATLSPAK